MKFKCKLFAEQKKCLSRRNQTFSFLDTDRDWLVSVVHVIFNHANVLNVAVVVLILELCPETPAHFGRVCTHSERL